MVVLGAKEEQLAANSHLYVSVSSTGNQQTQEIYPRSSNLDIFSRYTSSKFFFFFFWKATRTPLHSTRASSAQAPSKPVFHLDFYFSRVTSSSSLLSFPTKPESTPTSWAIPSSPGPRRRTFSAVRRYSSATCPNRNAKTVQEPLESNYRQSAKACLGSVMILVYVSPDPQIKYEHGGFTWNRDSESDRESGKDKELGIHFGWLVIVVEKSCARGLWGWGGKEA